MNVSDLITIIKKNFWNIITWGIGVMFLTFFIVTFFVSPKYSASIDVLVNQKVNSTQAQYTAQQTDLQAINTYKDVLKKPVILQSVLNDIKKKYNYQGNLENLQNEISIKNEASSQILTVTVKGDNAYVVANTANIIGKVFSKKIKNIMKVDNVSIVSKAKPDTNPVSPNRKLITLLGLLLGLLLGFAVATIRYLFDTTVKDEDFLTKELGLVSLGSIYHIPVKEDGYHSIYLKKTNSENQLRRRV